MNKEEHYLQNRLMELAHTSYVRNIYTYSDFLNISEQSILLHISKELPPVNFHLTGGNDYAERNLAVFAPQTVYYEQEPPISIIKIAPISPQYADSLSHRDFLGAILNLGITRAKIGDLFVKNNTAYVFCISEIAPYILENLSKIRHTLIQCSYSGEPTEQITPEFRTIQGTIGNIRLDSLIATAFSTSRSSIISYIEAGKVFVNGKLITSNGYTPKTGDIISVRGKGRFVYESLLKTTKKGRNLVSVKRYI